MPIIFYLVTGLISFVAIKAILQDIVVLGIILVGPVSVLLFAWYLHRTPKNNFSFGNNRITWSVLCLTAAISFSMVFLIGTVMNDPSLLGLS